MSSPQQRFLQTHHNHYLFADYYLDHRVSDLPEWRAADVAPVFAELRQRWAAFTPHHDNEAQTEEEWIRPVLKVLGHIFNVQTPLKTPFGTRKPDYLLYPDETSRQVAKAKSGAFDSEVLRATALAVADAKAWDRPLDQAVAPVTPKKGQVLSENPSLQIYIYIQHSGLLWGILTNGHQWRLVHRDTAEKLDVYYEVDLPALLDQGDLEAFKYFYLFFRREAFIDQPDTPAWLTQALEQSRVYARGVSDSLRDQVYEALRHLAQGFLDFPANKLTPDPAALKAVYDHSLIVLYRLLFILYAESRGLLPVPDNALYSRSYSLDAMKKRLARELDHGQPAAPSMTTFWQQLRQLWQVIDVGNPDLDVPAYNGGLFKSRGDSFLDTYQVGDVHLRQAIDLLARIVDPHTRQRVFVDYRDLEIRHLGSIYEGLLEYRVQVADRPLTVRVEKGREIYEPVGADDHSAVRVHPGQVYLTTDKGERKATGSYYTPDTIVKYIVEQTVRPVLDNARAPGGSETRQELDALAQAILSLNVLDPSMGSGHFLVEATDFIARGMVELGLHPPADAAGESDLAYWRRRVAQSCIYGVDVNPLAVELAKLSLWLTTVAKGKPLSFLDHHLRCGNSLIGSRVADLLLEGGAGRPAATKPKRKNQQRVEQRAIAAGQLSMLDDSAFAGSMRTATGFMNQIELLRSDTLAEVQEAEQLYRQVIEEVTARARQLADVWTARLFGLPELDETVWNGLARFVLHGGFEMPQYGRILTQARDLAAQYRFFHWELDFPEVFFDRNGQFLPGAGFDAVIGNPPYVRQEQVSAIKPYLAQAHNAVYDGVADIYVYFYHQGLELLRPNGRLSYIVTNKWLRAGYGEPLRGYFASAALVEQIVDFGHAPIFADADTFPCIILLRKPEAEQQDDAADQTEICPFPREVLGQVELATYVREHSYYVSAKRFSAQPWSLERGDVDELMEKLRRTGLPLTEFIDSSTAYGIKTGLNTAFLIDTPIKNQLVSEHPSSAEIIKPYLRGQDIDRWLPDWSGLWMIFSRRGIRIDDYPAIKRHLSQFREQLEPKPPDWKGSNWKGRKPGTYQWYEIQDSIDYWELFTKPKILYQEIQFHSRFALDTQGYFSNNKVFLIPKADLYLLAVLNSPVIWWYNWRYLPHMKDEALTPVGALMEHLPIAPPTEAIRAEVEPAVERLITLTQEQRQNVRDVLDWLGLQFGIDKPGQQLTAFDALSEESFLKEIERRRPRSAGRLTPADLRALRDTYQKYTPPLRQLQHEMKQLEQRLAMLVNAAYHLTPEEIDLLWRTAPPRTPVGPPNDQA